MQGPRAVLIDGYNVLHAIPKFAPRGRDLGLARDRFEAWLAEAVERARVERCFLVWDGRAGNRDKRAGRLAVLYTAAGTSADERILELCRGPFAASSASTWVVSSDRDVREPARQLGFPTLGAMEFYRRWAALAGIQDPARIPPSRAEIDELLEAFRNAEGDRG